MAKKEKRKYQVKEKLEEIKDLKLDLITFEVLRNGFVAACYEASTTIERIAYHPVTGWPNRSNAILTATGGWWLGHTDAAAHYASFRRPFRTFKDIPKKR
jgi:N-methylhydantoinase B/oxoprolinase/acetone carboxylase alpha subunit